MFIYSSILYCGHWLYLDGATESQFLTNHSSLYYRPPRRTNLSPDSWMESYAVTGLVTTLNLKQLTFLM